MSLLVSVSLTVMADHIIMTSSSIHSLSSNAIGTKGAMAVSAAMKRATNLKELKLVNLYSHKNVVVSMSTYLRS